MVSARVQIGPQDSSDDPCNQRDRELLDDFHGRLPTDVFSQPRQIDDIRAPAGGVEVDTSE